MSTNGQWPMADGRCRQDAEPVAVVRVCAWCPPAVRGPLERAALTAGRPVSHGICPACARDFFGVVLANRSPIGDGPAPLFSEVLHAR